MSVRERWQIISGWLIVAAGVPLCIASLGSQVVGPDGWINTPDVGRWVLGAVGLVLIYGGWERARG